MPVHEITYTTRTRSAQTAAGFRPPEILANRLEAWKSSTQQLPRIGKYMTDPQTTALPDFTIRKAIEADTPLLLAFIKDIAEFEKMSDQVQATVDTLRESLFGSTPAGEVVFGEVDGKAVAYAVFFHTFSTFAGKRGLWLEDLFVTPEHRGKGYGKALLKYLARVAVERDCARFEWTVLDWNTDAQAVYQKIGAVMLDDWRINRLTGETLNTFAQETS